jgi:hypothetical protein
VQANAMAAEPAEQARLALSFHRLSRGVRQTAALRMRLAREAERGGREAAAEVVSLQKARVERRKGQVKAAIESLIWTEAEGDDSTLSLDLEDLLDIETQDPDTFAQEDLDEQVQRFAQKLGLPSPPPCGEGAGGGGVSAGCARPGASPQPHRQAHGQHPHPNPSPSPPPLGVASEARGAGPQSGPVGGGALDDYWRPSG